MKTWVNGTILEAAESFVSVFDHGLTVGDGVFETTKVVDGTPFALTRHLVRLQSSARGLGLPDPDLDLVRHAVDDVLLENDTDGALRLRITYTGGVSPLGSDRGDSAPTLVVALAPIKAWAPGARMTWAARMCQIRWRDTPGAAGVRRWSVRFWAAMT